jgi:hypothetical protein
MHPVFRRALIPEPRFRCLRLPLQPLTLGHLFLLQALDSPLLNAGRDVERGDLLLAVAICSRPHAKAQRLLLCGWRTTLFLWWWGFRCRHVNIVNECAVFCTYLNEERAMPATVRGNSSRELLAPIEWRLYCELTAAGMSREQVLDTPVIAAQCLWATRMEAEGKIQLVNESVISRLWAKAHAN